MRIFESYGVYMMKRLNVNVIGKVFTLNILIYSTILHTSFVRLSSEFVLHVYFLFSSRIDELYLAIIMMP